MSYSNYISISGSLVFFARAKATRLGALTTKNENPENSSLYKNVSYVITRVVNRNAYEYRG